MGIANTYMNNQEPIACTCLCHIEVVNEPNLRFVEDCEHCNPNTEPIACTCKEEDGQLRCVYDHCPIHCTPLKGDGGGGRVDYKNVDLSKVKVSSSCGGSEPCNGCSTHPVKGDVRKNRTTEDVIYKILFDSSRVSDGVRCINEDEWPISELASLLDTQKQEYIQRLEKEKKPYDATWDKGLDKAIEIIKEE